MGMLVYCCASELGEAMPQQADTGKASVVHFIAFTLLKVKERVRVGSEGLFSRQQAMALTNNYIVEL
ncbi:hypothetical protein FNV43_RR27243 [Rhamnella rubrinervis]|uniref:Uncharacterized protein n=1 Tax=Rhamnella rubrinervis TaxID=2594499 RepID=A0A8K0DP24_9ROSA|nr:hypothetical protein FNV43_RR27243 [Rhamnella rubrinervis]